MWNELNFRYAIRKNKILHVTLQYYSQRVYARLTVELSLGFMVLPVVCVGRTITAYCLAPLPV